MSILFVCFLFWKAVTHCLDNLGKLLRDLAKSAGILHSMAEIEDDNNRRKKL